MRLTIEVTRLNHFDTKLVVKRNRNVLLTYAGDLGGMGLPLVPAIRSAVDADGDANKRWKDYARYCKKTGHPTPDKQCGQLYRDGKPDIPLSGKALSEVGKATELLRHIIDDYKRLRNGVS